MRLTVVSALCPATFAPVWTPSAAIEPITIHQWCVTAVIVVLTNIFFIRERTWGHAKENHEWCLKVSVAQMHRSQSPFPTTGATTTLQCTWFVFSSQVNYLFSRLSFHFPQDTRLSWQSWVSLSSDGYIQPGQKRTGHKRIKVNIMPLLGPVNWYLKFPSEVQTPSMLHQSGGFWTSPASVAGVY